MKQEEDRGSYSRDNKTLIIFRHGPSGFSSPEPSRIRQTESPSSFQTTFLGIKAYTEDFIEPGAYPAHGLLKQVARNCDGEGAVHYEANRGKQTSWCETCLIISLVSSAFPSWITRHESDITAYITATGRSLPMENRKPMMKQKKEEW